jgi:NAD(P)-dependent dehydrogenase (short-subunit alcohol dehydrogenase family)
METPPRTVLVTGASRGIGQATVNAFVASGWRVVAGMRDPADATDVPGRHVVRLDVTDPSSIRDAVGTAHEVAGGPLACVVNNAGWALFGAVEDVDLDIARREFETNLFGAVAVIQAALPAMRQAGSGVVVGVSSLCGRIPVPLFGMYSASKLALAAVLEALALEVGPAGVRAVLIEAGVVRTEFARSTIVSGAAGEPESPYAGARAGVLGTFRGIREECGLEPHEVADAIVAAVEDEGAPFRSVLADRRLGVMAPDAAGDGERHAQARRLFDLAPPPGVGRLR